MPAPAWRVAQLRQERRIHGRRFSRPFWTRFFPRETRARWAREWARMGWPIWGSFYPDAPDAQHGMAECIISISMPHGTVSASTGPAAQWGEAVRRARECGAHRRAAWYARIVRASMRAHRRGRPINWYCFDATTHASVASAPTFVARTARQRRHLRTLLRLSRREPGWLTDDERRSILDAWRNATTRVCTCGQTLLRANWRLGAYEDSIAAPDADACHACGRRPCTDPDCGLFSCDEPLCVECEERHIDGEYGDYCSGCAPTCCACGTRHSCEDDADECCRRDDDDDDDDEPHRPWVGAYTSAPTIGELDPRRTVPMGVEYELCYVDDGRQAWDAWQRWASNRKIGIVAASDTSIRDGWETKIAPMPIGSWLGAARKKDGGGLAPKPHLAVLSDALAAHGAEWDPSCGAHVHYDARCCSALWIYRAATLLGHDESFWLALSERSASADREDIQEARAHMRAYCPLPSHVPVKARIDAAKDKRATGYGSLNGRGALNLSKRPTVELRLLAASVGRVDRSGCRLREHIETAFAFYCAARDTSLRHLDRPADALLEVARREGLGAAERRIRRAIAFRPAVEAAFANPYAR